MRHECKNKYLIQFISKKTQKTQPQGNRKAFFLFEYRVPLGRCENDVTFNPLETWTYRDNFHTFSPLTNSYQ